MVLETQRKIQHGKGLLGRGSNTPERSLVIFKKVDSEERWEKKGHSVRKRQSYKWKVVSLILW